MVGGELRLRGKTEAEVQSKLTRWLRAKHENVRVIKIHKIEPLPAKSGRPAFQSSSSQIPDAFFVLIEYETHRPNTRRRERTVR